MRTDRCVELQFDEQQSKFDFGRELEALCQRLDEQVNYIIEVDDNNRKIYINLDEDRDCNTLTIGHVHGVLTSKVLGQNKEVFCKCSSPNCWNRPSYKEDCKQEDVFCFFEDGTDAMGWLEDADMGFWMFSPAVPVKAGDKLYDKNGNFLFVYGEVQS